MCSIQGTQHILEEWVELGVVLDSIGKWGVRCWELDIGIVEHPTRNGIQYFTEVPIISF